jgi:hypothetical protein
MADTQPKLIKVTNQREIPIKPEMVLGRQAECDLQLTEGHASRKHAKLFIATDGVWLEDLNSANGSFVNGVKVTGKVKLSSGDRLRFDVEEFTRPVLRRRSTTADSVSRARLGRRGRHEQRRKRPGAWAIRTRWATREQDEVHRSRAAQADGHVLAAVAVIRRRSMAYLCGVRQSRGVEHRSFCESGVGNGYRQPGGPRVQFRTAACARTKISTKAGAESVRPDVGGTYAAKRSNVSYPRPGPRGPDRSVHLPTSRAGACRGGPPARRRARRARNRRAKPC